MKKIIKIWILLFVCLLFIDGFNTLSAIENAKATEAEWLQKLENSTRDTNRLNILKKLIAISKQDEAVKHYANALIEEAKYQKKPKYECEAFLYLITHAYNGYKVTDANHWMEQLEPLARKNKYYDILFQAKRLMIDLLMVNGEYELEEKEALKMLQDAQEQKNVIGIVSAYQCLSNAYQITYRYKNAAEVLEKAYLFAPQVSLSSPVEISNSLIAIYSSLNDKKNWLKWIQIQEKYLLELDKQELGLTSWLQGWTFITNLSYLVYYTTVDQLEIATKYLKLSENNIMKDYRTIELRYHQARCEYFIKTNQFEKALVEADALVNLFQDNSALSRNAMVFYKAKILRKLGREKEALVLYKRSCIESDSLQFALMETQTEELKKSYIADKIRLQEEQLNRSNQLLLLSLISITFCILAYWGVYIYRIQKKLRRSEEEMREMALEMEQANIAKEKFLSTISTAISAPLNTVVEGSLLLASDKTIADEQRRDTSESISRISTQLMNLINNILNHSRLEAGMMKFKDEPIDFITFVSEILFAHKAKEHQDIKIQLPEKGSLVITGDKLHLKEMLNNLLNNGKGLSIEIKEDGKELQVFVWGSILSTGDQRQEIKLLNEVNRLIIEHLGGKYKVVTNGIDSFIYFTLFGTAVDGKPQGKNTLK